MSNDNIVQFKRDKAEGLIRAAEEFESNVLACIKDAQKAGVEGWMLVGKLHAVIVDVEFNAVTFDPDGDEPA